MICVMLTVICVLMHSSQVFYSETSWQKLCSVTKSKNRKYPSEMWWYSCLDKICGQYWLMKD